MQNDFNKLIELVKHQNNKIAIELFSNYNISEISYSTSFFDVYSENNRLDLINLYNSKWEFEKQRIGNQFVYGFEELIPSLMTTKVNNICISIIHSSYGTYVLFTDFNKNIFIGILKTKRTLEEIRQKYNKHKKKIEEQGEIPIYDYSSNEIVFLNGNLINKKADS